MADFVYEEFRGARDLVYAPISADSATALTYGEVKPLAGLQAVSKETESSSATSYYDNVPAIVIESQGADTIKLTVSAISLETLADLTGQSFDSTTGSLIEGPRDTKYFAIGYRVKMTTGKERFVWRYKGTFSLPSTENKTEDNGTDTTNQELTFTGINTTHKFTKTGKTAKGIVTPSEKVDETTFFEDVATPDSVTAKTGS